MTNLVNKNILISSENIRDNIEFIIGDTPIVDNSHLLIQKISYKDNKFEIIAYLSEELLTAFNSWKNKSHIDVSLYSKTLEKQFCLISNVKVEVYYIDVHTSSIAQIGFRFSKKDPS